jgi:4-amino-4-deoxy-L-arabinose transferase-like glycosyltransferase
MLMRLENRPRTGLLLAGAIGFAALAQFYFFYRRAYAWDGVIFCGLALLCFSRLLRQADARETRQAKTTRTPLVQRWRALLVGSALLLNLIAARAANTQPPPANHTPSVFLWLASLVLFCAAFISLEPTSRPRIKNLSLPRPANREQALELALVLGLLLTGLLLRGWDLEHIPANLSGDEGTQGTWAVDVLEGRVRNPFATGWFTVPTMSFFAQAASLRLFGDSVAGLRTLSALVGAATLLFTYLLARQELGPRIALFALAALTFNHYHLHFSRLASNQIADPLFMALTLWLLTRGLKEENGDRRSEIKTDTQCPKGTTRNTQHAARNTQPWFLAAGLTMGLSWYGYFGSRLIALVVAVYLGLQAIAERGFVRRHGRALALMVLAAWMVASPLLLYYKNYPQNVSARFNQVSFFRWFEAELARPQHDTPFNLVVRQIWRSVSAFNHTLDPTFWYLAQIPLLDFVSGVLFVLGLIIALGQWRRAAIRLTLLWFGLALTFGWILTENPPSSMRMTIIAPAVALLVALGLDRLLSLARWAVGGSRAQWTQVGLVLMVVVAALNVHYYFGVYTPTRVYGNRNAESSTVLARYLSGRDDQPFVYFYGPPVLYYDFGTLRFMARDVPGTDVLPDSQEPDYATQAHETTLFVVLKERLGELAALQARQRGGRLREFYSEADGRLMFVVYEVRQ